MSDAMRVAEIVNHILGGVELEKRNEEYIFTRGPHNVAWQVERFDNIPSHSIKQISRGIIYDLVNLELEGVR